MTQTESTDISQTQREWDKSTNRNLVSWANQTHRTRSNEWGESIDLVEAIEVHLENGQTMRVLENVTPNTPATEIVQKLGIPKDGYDVCFFLMGGAKGMSEEKKAKLATVLTERFQNLADQKRVLFGDGGTDSGVMEMLNDALADLAQTNDEKDYYIGFAPREPITYPGWREAEADTTPIGSEHTHLVPVASTQPVTDIHQTWGAETDKMYEVFGQLAEDKESEAMLVNGGAITVREFLKNIEQNRTVTIVKGSGRAADMLAAIIETGHLNVEELESRFEAAVVNEVRGVTSSDITVWQKFVKFIDLED